MPCSDPPELNTADLLAALDGHAAPTVSAHLAHCAYCRHKLADIARLEQRLATQLYRVACPDTSELGEWQLGMLPESQARILEAHVAICPHCQAELATLTSFLQDVAPTIEPSLATRVRTLVATLVRGALDKGPGLPLLAPVGVRGGGPEPLVYEAGDLQIMLTAEPALSGIPDRRDLVGLVLGEIEQIERVVLIQNDDQIAEQPADAAGNFLLPDVAPGMYRLALHTAAYTVVIPDVQIV